MLVRWNRHVRIAARKQDGRWYLLKDGDRGIRELNKTASLLWEALEDWVSIKKLTSLLLAHYDVDAKVARADIENFIAIYLREGFLEKK